MLDVVCNPRYGDYKDFDTLKRGAVLDIIQDVAIRDSAMCGYDVKKLKDISIAWLMQGIKIQFLDEVSTNCPLQVFTAVKNMSAAASERCTTISQDGKTVVRCVANWFTFNIQKGRVCKIPDEIRSAYQMHDFDDDFFVYEKPELIDGVECSYKIKVANKDIDTNMHLNNQKSAEMLLDALPFEYKFGTMTVFYKKAAFLGDELDVCVKKMSDGYYVHLANSENEICVVGRFTDVM